MLAIRGIYNGKRIEPLEEIPFKGKMNVIITFIEELVAETNSESEVDPIKALRGCAIKRVDVENHDKIKIETEEMKSERMS